MPHEKDQSYRELLQDIPHGNDKLLQNLLQNVQGKENQPFAELLLETMAEWAKIEKDIKDGKPIPPPAPRLRGQGITRNEGSRGGFYLEDHPGLGMMEAFDDDTDDLSDSSDEINEQIDRLLFDK